MSRPLGSRYRIGASIGRGGMGEVFLGEDDNGEIYAIKVLRPELAHDPEMVTRFVFERNALLRLRGPHVVAVHDLVIEGDDLAIVMELVPGGDLRQLVRRGPFPPSEAARVAAGIASALGVAHGAGMVHGDVKPENVLLDDRHAPPRARLADFGISRPPTAGAAPELIGSPRYLAPERWQGAAPSAAADLYALGIVLYELCCGMPPYLGEPAELRDLHLTASPGRPAGIPDSIWAVIVDLTSRDPAHRPGSATQVAARLEGLALLTAATPPGPPITAPPPPVRRLSAAPAPPVEDTTVVVAPVTGVSAAAALSWEEAAAAEAVPIPAQTWSPRRDGRRRALIAGAAVLALLAGVGAVFAASGGGGDDNAVAEPSVPQIIVPVATPTETPTETPTPTLSPSSTPTETPSASATPACEPVRLAPDGGLAETVRRSDSADRCHVAVRMIQSALGVLSDGYFGDRTERAIRKYQWERCPTYPNRGSIDTWTWNSVIRNRTESCPDTAQPTPTPTVTVAPTSTTPPPTTPPPTTTPPTTTPPTTTPPPTTAPPATGTT